MNITTFKEKVLLLNLNEVEIKRINNLSGRHYKFLTLKYATKYTGIGEHNYKEIWSILNPILAEEERFHRRQTHMIRNPKHQFVDYSEFKGTKGKWIISDENESNGIKLNKCISITSTCDMCWDICAVWNDLEDEKGKSNALLISKAPEMLGMLIELREIFDKYRVDNEQQFSKYKQSLEKLIKEATEL